MRLLWCVHSHAEHVRVLGPLDGLAGGPSLGAFADVWPRRVGKLSSRAAGCRRDLATRRGLAGIAVSREASESLPAV